MNENLKIENYIKSEYFRTKLTELPHAYKLVLEEVYYDL